ncbi:MAG: hypothetical protein AAB011_01570 [Candidatus Eisenbacteria bacterium]
MSAAPPGPRNSILALLLLTLFAASPQTANAVPIDGKYGLGIDAGDLLSTGAEAALIYGRSEKTAWLLLINASGSFGDTDFSRDYATPDTLIEETRGYDGFSISLGPGVRKFIRSTEHFSPYFDLKLQGIRSVYTEDRSDGSPDSRGYRGSEWGVEGGFAIGAEYFFEKWPVSLAAHANLVTARYSHRVQKQYSSYSRNESVDDSFSMSEGLGPRLQVRVYF